jgi:5'-3' exonuclease
MKELLEKYGFLHYATGCSCQGLPKYYKHSDFTDFRVILKSGYGIIKKNGTEKFRTKDIEQFKLKLLEYGIITENQDVETQQEKP